MEMNSCPLCGTPDANGFCACLSVMAKSEDMIDLKNAADPKKRIKEVNGPHPGKLPSDAKIKEVDVGDGSGDLDNLKKDLAIPTKQAPAGAWGGLPHHEKVARVQSLMSNPQMQNNTLGEMDLARKWMARFGGQPKTSSIPGLNKTAMPLEKGLMPGTMKGDAAQASFNATTKPTTPIKPMMPSQSEHAARADMYSDFTPPGNFSPPTPNPMGAPRTIPGAKAIGPAGGTKLPGTDIKQPPKVKQNVGGDIVSPNPPKAAPGLGSMRLARSEDQDQFEVFRKSEDFDFGTCALCGQNEHIGNCK